MPTSSGTVMRHIIDGERVVVEELDGAFVAYQTTPCEFGLHKYVVGEGDTEEAACEAAQHYFKRCAEKFREAERRSLRRARFWYRFFHKLRK